MPFIAIYFYDDSERAGSSSLVILRCDCRLLVLRWIPSGHESNKCGGGGGRWWGGGDKGEAQIQTRHIASHSLPYPTLPHSQQHCTWNLERRLHLQFISFKIYCKRNVCGYVFPIHVRGVRVCVVLIEMQGREYKTIIIHKEYKTDAFATARIRTAPHSLKRAYT